MTKLMTTRIIESWSCCCWCWWWWFNKRNRISRVLWANKRHNDPRILSPKWPLLSNIKYQLQIPTKLQLQNLDQTRLQVLNSPSKSRQNFSFKILTRLHLQNFDKYSGSKYLPNFVFKISTKLWSTRSLSSTSAALTTSRSFKLASSKTRVTPIDQSSKDYILDLSLCLL